VLSEPTLAVAVGFSHLTADPLHRILINDCGLLVSLCEGRPVPVDGEILAPDPAAVGAWVAHADAAPVWAAEMERLRRRSVDARESLKVAGSHIQSFLARQRAERIRAAVEGLHRRQSARIAAVPNMIVEDVA